MLSLDYCRVSGVFLFFCAVVSFISSIACFVWTSSLYLDWELFNYLGSEVTMTMIFDWMSLGFLSFVLFISSNVMLYSVDYMGEDEGKEQFCFVVLMFVLSMVLLILSPNLISILLGWDGLGLVSYCLVIYYQNYRSYNAGMLTVLSNRIGDVALLMAISLMLDWGDWEYELYSDVGGGGWVIVGLCMLAAMTSSAQIPFSAWLPAAMAAPTPVSALVHSSTLVTAGVYLMIRFSGAMTLGSSFFLMLVACATMFMAGAGANYEYDLKKIIALSTLSQLGLMMMSLSLGMVELAYFHLLTHAIFKALLFLCAGAIIHTSSDWQDIRSMGEFVYSLPLVGSCMMVSSFALCGFPFLAGFYSKDMILEWMMMGDLSSFILVIMLVSIGLTACYSFRLGYYVMVNESGGGSLGGVEDGGVNMYFPLIVLTFFGVVVGGLFMWVLFPWQGYVCLPFWLKISGVLFMSLGVWLGVIIGWGESSEGGGLVSFLGDMWFMPDLSSQYVSSFFVGFGEGAMKLADLGWGEKSGGQGLDFFFWVLSMGLQWWQNNSLKLFLFTFFLWGWASYLMF